MNILITGHKGFIGSNLVKALQDEHNIVTHEWGDDEVNLEINLTDTDWVLHIGAISATTERNVEKVMKQNYDFSCWLLDKCLDREIHFQYASSASVYGLNPEYAETSPVDPRTPYSWSKYMFERYAATRLAFARHIGVQVQGFRYFNVYGNGEDHKGSQGSPVTQFRNQAKSSKIKLFHNSDQYLRDFIAVEDVCRVHQQFFDVKQSGIWNLGTGSTASFEHIAQLIAARDRATIEYIPMPEILVNNYQAYTCSDNTKLESTIGPQQWITVDEWLQNNV